MICAKILLIFALANQVTSSAIPIWELLTHHEKIGNLTFIFLQLVHLYCKHSDIPDCEKVLTLYGVSNLLKENETTLDLLDPYQRNSRDIIWRTVMNGAFDLPAEDDNQLPYGDLQTEFERDFNTISNSEIDNSLSNHYDYEDDISERYPYAVRVPPPPNFGKAKGNSGPTPSENKNLGKTLQGFSTQPSSERHQQPQEFQAESFQNPPGLTTVKTHPQNSRVISIIPHVQSPGEGGTPSAPRNVVSDTPLRVPPTRFGRNQGDKNTFYILPSDERRDPILLRILES